LENGIPETPDKYDLKNAERHRLREEDKPSSTVT